MSHKVNLSCLEVTCQLLDMPGSHLWTLHLLCKLPDLACGNLVQVYVAIIYCLEDKLFTFKEELKDVPMRYLGSIWGYLAKATWVWTAWYHSSTDLFPLWKLVRRSNLALTSLDVGLLNSSNFSHIVSSISSSLDKLQETYWSMSKSLPQAIPSCISFFLVAWQAQSQGCSHTSNAI